MAAFMGLIEELLNDTDHPRFGRWVGNNLYVFKPKSTKFSKAGQKKFNKVRDDACEIIEQEIGVSCDQLLKEAEKSA